MPSILVRDLLGMPVETELGTRLGFFADGEMDTETRQLLAIMVKPHRLSLAGKAMRIHGRHIVAVTAEKIVVQDAAVEANESAPSVLVAPATAGGNLRIQEEGGA